MSSWFGTKKTTFTEQLLSNAVDDVSEIANEVMPTLKDDILKNMRIKNIYNNVNVKNGLQEIQTIIGTKLKDNWDDVKSTEAKRRINEKIEEYKLITTENKDVTFFERFKYAKKCLNYLKGKKSIKVVCIGNTQVGKTNTLKYLMNLPDEKIKIGKGLESDTSSITEHKCEQNGVEFVVADCPGFYDSKQRGETFYQELLKYLKDNSENSDEPIDTMLWFAKLGDIVDEKIQDTINKLARDLGTNFFGQTIIMLTYANSVKPPQSYYDDAIKILKNSTKKFKREDVDLYAWKEYTTAIKNSWKIAFNKYNPNIDIVLIENNEFENGKYDTGFGVLKDGTPIVETFYDTLFNMIGINQRSVAFVFLAGNIQDKQIDQSNTNINSNNKLTEQQTALNKVVDKAFQNDTSKEKSGGWCSII